MKKIFLTSVLFYMSLTVNAQWQWAKQIGGGDDESAEVYEQNGSMYVTGAFSSNSFHIDSDILSCNGHNDMYLAKYDLTCTNRSWLKTFGGSNSSFQSEWGSIGLVTSNAIYFYGRFSGTMTIDGITVDDIGSLDPFLAKFDLNGNCQWIKHAGGGSGINGSTGVLMDSNGYLYWSIDLKTDGMLDSAVVNKGSLLVKLDESGSILSIKNELIIGGTITSLKIRNDELFFCGATYNDTTILGNDTLFGDDNADCFIGKLDLSGNMIWSKRFQGGTPVEGAYNFDFDSGGNLYVVGQYIDTLTMNGNIVIAPAIVDGFIAKFDPNGTNTWIKNLHASAVGENTIYSIMKDASGMFYVTGVFSGTAQFGIFSVTAANVHDMFLARYNSNGDCMGVYNFGKARAYSLTVNSSNEVVVSGDFENTVNIGTEAFTSRGLMDIFIAKADAIVGIEETGRQSNQLVIFANPNKGDFSIKVPEAITTFNDAWLYVFDNTGKEIARFSLDGKSDKPHFDVSHHSKGTYSVRLVQGNKSYSGKMVVE
jgi:Secretion system C-terminal sorting domain